MSDSPTQTLREALRRYFERAGFAPDGGYSDKWVKLKLGPIPFGFPNVPSRVRAVRFHDLHHVVTGYATDWTGEAEISAWEIASSCADHYAAWALNFSGILIGMVVAPQRTFQAFVRGRHSRNLYREPEYEALLERSVDDVRSELRLADEAPNATLADRLTFVGWSTAAALWAVAVTAVVTTPVVLLVGGLLSG